MEIFHARDLTCPLYSFSIIKLEGGHDLPNEIARILKRYVPDESKK